jgi:hypothetical protein
MSSMPPTPSPAPGPAVTLTTDRVAYTPSDAITVTLVNGHSASVFTTDHHTGCSIITLRQQAGSGWRDVGGCRMGIATRIVEIPAGETKVVTLPPGAGELRPMPWPVGTYRAQVRYGLSRETLGDLAVESADFVVS